MYFLDPNPYKNAFEWLDRFEASTTYIFPIGKFTLFESCSILSFNSPGSNSVYLLNKGAIKLGYRITISN